MKKKLRILLVAVMCIGFFSCTTMQKGDFTYQRFGNQSLQGLDIHYIETDGDIDLTVELDSQKSEREIAEVIRDAIKTIDRAVKIIESLESKIPGLF